VKTDDTASGIAPDSREGTTLRTSATTGTSVTLEQATRVALTSLIRQADARSGELDATTVSVEVKMMRTSPGEGGRCLVIATGTSYSGPYLDGMGVDGFDA
jgi:hypothetical protein